MAIDHPDGVFPSGPLHADQLDQQGYSKCRNQLCEHRLDPEMLEDHYDTFGPQGSLQCSHCGLDQFPHLTPGKPGGGTNSGLPMEVQGQIGEDLVKNMGNIPGYGPITWWHVGGAVNQSALDGATPEWGIEVKTYNWTNVRKRGIIHPRDKAAKARAINDPHLFAQEMEDPKLDAVLHRFNLRGLLGILVLLDFENSTADVFAHEMVDPEGGPLQPSHIKHITRQVVLAEGVPFDNPLPDPRQPGWVPAYQQQAVQPEVPF